MMTEQSTGETRPLESLKVLLILNPVSGLVDETTRLTHYQSFFVSRGWECRVFHTAAGTSTVAAVRTAIAQGASLVAVSGGDGTISEAATALRGSSVPMGILPSGTGNILARDLGIPLNADRALELLVSEHRLRPIDLMQVGDRCHALNVSIGISAQTMATIERQQKKRFGILAYILNGLANLTGARLHRLEIHVDGTKYRVRASEVMVGNSSLVGFRRMLRHLEILPDDGAVDVIISRALTLWDWLLVLINFVLGIKSNKPRFHILQARQSIQVSSISPLTVQADGDVIGQTPVDIQVAAGAVQVIVPGSSRSLVNEFLRITGLVRPDGEQTHELGIG